jgi:predicted secreted protein
MSIRFRFLACLAIFALSGCAGTPAQAQASGVARDAAVSPPLNHLSLSASASIEVPMDELSVTLAVVREAPEAATVQAQMSQVMEAALVESRRQARPGELEVRTGAFSLNPRYAPPPARPAPGYTPSIVGWQGRAELHLEGRDQRAVASLAGRLSGLSVARVGYSLSRQARERAEAQTTREAITRFRERAQSYAEQFGMRTYAVREVQVGMDGGPPPYAQERGLVLRAAAMPMADVPLPVEAGRTTVTSTVSGSIQMLP